MTHQFRARLANGELLIGAVVTLSCPEVAEVLAGAGFDWLFIDAEHSPLEARDMQALLQGAGREAGVRLGIFGASPDAVRPYIEKGYTLIAVGGDTLMLGGAAKRVLAEL